MRRGGNPGLRMWWPTGGDDSSQIASDGLGARGDREREKRGGVGGAAAGDGGARQHVLTVLETMVRGRGRSRGKGVDQLGQKQ